MDDLTELATGYTLTEAPLWDEAKGLYFTDTRGGGVYLLGHDGRVTTVLPKRRGIGGMALHAEGGLVVGGREILWIPLEGGASRVLLSTDVTPVALGFNDLTTDHAGRIYVGSVAYRVLDGGEPVPGHLHVIDLDGSARTLSDGILMTNGLGVSPDGKRLYQSDNKSALVRVYDVDADGSVGPWRTFTTLGPGGEPDGLKVASDGSVWVADAHGGRVAVFEPDGSHRRDIRLPLPMVSSLCFGGADLRDLYVTTGSRNGPRENCGTVFRMRVDVSGLPLARARVGLG